MVASVELAIQVLVGRISDGYGCSRQNFFNPIVELIPFGFGGCERSFDRRNNRFDPCMARAAISFRRRNLEFAASEAARNEVLDSRARKQLDHWPTTQMSAKYTKKYKANFICRVRVKSSIPELVLTLSEYSVGSWLHTGTYVTQSALRWAMLQRGLQSHL